MKILISTLYLGYLLILFIFVAYYMDNNRRELLKNFLNKSSDSFDFNSIKKIAGDASFRSYYRLKNKGGESYILMDAPPEFENIEPFVRVGEYLLNNGFSSPKIYNKDRRSGFLLLEDFGDSKYSTILKNETNSKNYNTTESELYEKAIDALIELQDNTETNTQLNPYDNSVLTREVKLFIEWYVPFILKKELDKKEQDDYVKIWFNILKNLDSKGLSNDSMNQKYNVMLLRDYHADNLIYLQGRVGYKQVGLLDFQDALLGSRAYDLVSLLEDARRDIDPELSDKMLKYYFKNIDKNISQERISSEYNILSLQRNMKIVGIFSRLSVRDNKDHYLNFLPRVFKYIQKDLSRNEKLFKDLSDWLQKIGVEWIR